MEQLETISAATSAASCAATSLAVAGPASRQSVHGRSQPGISFIGRIQASLEKILRGAISRLIGSSEALVSGGVGLTRTARLRRLSGRSNGCAASNRQEWRKGFIQDSANGEWPDGLVSEGRDWVPLVKASSAITAVPVRNCPANPDSAHGDQAAPSCASPNLAGRCILCVDGRAALYPEYRRLVETSGGNLLIYRSNSQGETRPPPLPALLAQADMVICPVDCVNHHAFFTVKRYCRHSGKPCVLLDRSGLSTFRKGVAALAALTAAPAQT